MKNFSFRKAERIRKTSEFLAVAKSGKRYYTEHFTVIFSPNDRQIRRLGLSVGKKIGKSVRRNRVKRLIREFFRLNKANFPHSHDVLVIAKEGSSDLNYHEVHDELTKLLLII